MKLKNETYDRMKNFVQIVMPAIVVFIGTVGSTLNWEQTELTMTLLSAFNIFLGTILGISNTQYKKEEEKQ